MQFIVDAQLPRVLATRLTELGHDTIHVKQLPRGGDTPDAEITHVADGDGRCVVTKDTDSRHTHETGGHPRRLLLITVGNVKNRDLLALIERHLVAMTTAFDQADFVELGHDTLTLHDGQEHSSAD
jgi:predicted nuclease of predicted toxin-antitoxin system